MRRSLIMAETCTYVIELLPTTPSGYSVYVPALPGIVTFGDDVEDALANAREAIAGHIETLRMLGRPAPAESPARLRRPQRLHVQVAAHPRQETARSAAATSDAERR
jgi:antitoxin HicB